MAKIHPQSNTEAGLKFCVYLTPPLSKSWCSWGRWQQRASGYDHMHGEERSGGVIKSGTLGQKYWLNPLNIGPSCSCTSWASVHQPKVWARALMEREHKWMNPLLGVGRNWDLLEDPSSPGGGQPQATVCPNWAWLSSGDPPGALDPPLRQRCPPWCPCVVGQTWGHVAGAAEQKVWIRPCSAWARAEPSLLGANVLLGHPFWEALL